jgi:hypothetical protein
MIPGPGIPLWVLEHWNLQFALTSTSFTFMHGLGAIDTTVKTGPGTLPLPSSWPRVLLRDAVALWP